MNNPAYTMQLRNYQQDSITAIEKAYKDGLNKQVIVLATGLGKTIIFSHLISDLVERTGKKALVIAHREELLTQAKDKLQKVNPLLKVGIEQGWNKVDDENGHDVIVASVPTLGRATSERIKKFDPMNFCIIVCDEAHHASNETYKSIFRYFGVLKNDPEDDWHKDCLLLGVTATPSRSDNKGIDQVFDKVTFNFGIIEGIQKNWLARIRAFRVDTSTDLSKVKKTAGDFNLGELGDAVNTEERNKLIVKGYKDIVPNEQALCFAVDVAHTEQLAQTFRDEGISATHVVGTTDKEVRAQRLADFASGRVKVMVNAMVLTEGYDNESIQAILMARPTQSGILYQQMIGRGTRIHPNKKHLTVIDFVDNTYRQSLQTSASLLGIPGNLNFKGKDILDVKEEVDKLLELAPNANLEKLDIDKIKYAIEEVDLLSGLKIPDELSGFTTYDWHRYDEDTFNVGLSNHTTMSVKRTLTGQFIVTERLYNIETKEEVIKEIGSYETLSGAIYNADKYISAEHSDSLILISDNAGWRTDKPSDPQMKLLRKFRVSDIVLSQLSKGQASRLITKLINHQRRGLQRQYS